MYIRRIGRIKPRQSVEFFQKNPDLFKKLRSGESIEIPNEVFKELEGVAEVQLEVNTNESKKKLKKKLDEIKE